MTTGAELDEETKRGQRRGPGIAHVAAGLVTAAYWFVLMYAFMLVSWGNSVCGDVTPDKVAAQREAVAGFGFLAAIVPAVIALLFGRRHRASATAWAVIAVVPIVIGLAAAPSARPAQWCLF